MEYRCNIDEFMGYGLLELSGMQRMEGKKERGW
jgi:hypothetical protein